MARKKVFEIESVSCGGIYAIINVKKMACYIGSSENIKQRAGTHAANLKSNCHANKFLQADFNNGEKFDFLILECVENIEKEELIAKEKMYMLTAIESGFEIYNLMPKTKKENQTEWIKQHLIWFLMSHYNTKENLLSAFKNRYGVNPAYMKNRKPENRM